VGLLALTAGGAARQQPFQIDEATIAQLHAAMRDGRLTCRALVDHYLARIEAYDKQGPALNALIVLNPGAVAEAEAMDARFRESGGPTRPLDCIPAIAKDNFETIGLQSAAGSKSLEGFISDRDAFQVRRIKEAGAIVLAKSNMDEFAFSPYQTLSSIQGHTKNPYALDRVPAGSSGGTAAAVASNFGAIGLGSDTGNSIRGPSSHTALVGIRSTMGLTSRAGVIPLSFNADVAGPITRTVEDAIAVLQVIAGEDPDDPMTARIGSRPIPRYADSLVAGGLEGARIGILRQAYQSARTEPDAEVLAVFAKALDDLRAAGAEIVERVEIADVPRERGTGGCRGFAYDMNDYLKTRGANAPRHTLDEIIESGLFHDGIRRRMEGMLGQTGQGPETEACQADTAYRQAFGAALTAAMDGATLDALVYPTWSHPPRLIGDLESPHGDNSQVHSPRSGFPAINVPMGYTREGALPIGITFLGRAWDEPTLIRLAYGYEQATRHRRPPASTPVIR
jgi:Asp-tRNA(Asn)/Glu-tRNA(Gln) amidotransferase A subunit family amidase